MAGRKQIFVRLYEPQEAAIDEIGEEMAQAAGVEVGNRPFYNSDGTVNRSEVIRRLLGKADRRLREP